MVREVKVSREGGHHWDWPGARSGFSDVDEIPVWNKKDQRSKEKNKGNRESGECEKFSDPARGGEASRGRKKGTRSR